MPSVRSTLQHGENKEIKRRRERDLIRPPNFAFPKKKSLTQEVRPKRDISKRWLGCHLRDRCMRVSDVAYQEFSMMDNSFFLRFIEKCCSSGASVVVARYGTGLPKCRKTRWRSSGSLARKPGVAPLAASGPVLYGLWLHWLFTEADTNTSFN